MSRGDNCGTNNNTRCHLLEMDRLVESKAIVGALIDFSTTQMGTINWTETYLQNLDFSLCDTVDTFL